MLSGFTSRQNELPRRARKKPARSLDRFEDLPEIRRNVVEHPMVPAGHLPPG
jgi:hypothetical protein